MNSNQNDVLAILSAQCRHQVRITRRRAAILPWLSAIGLFFSILGLIPPIASFLEEGSPTISLFVFAFFAVCFGGVWSPR